MCTYNSVRVYNSHSDYLHVICTYVLGLYVVICRPKRYLVIVSYYYLVIVSYYYLVIVSYYYLVIVSYYYLVIVSNIK